MRFWLETWTRPGDANFGRRDLDLPAVSSGFTTGLNGIGAGNADLGSNTDTSGILDPDTPLSSLVRLYSEADPDNPVGEWLPAAVDPTGDAEDNQVRINGSGMNAALAYARLEAFDWDGSDTFISRDPDWLYGGFDRAVNGSFEDAPYGIANRGFEDGTVEPWWAGAVPGYSANVAITTTNVDTGTYAMEVTPLRPEGGASTGMRLFPANFYTVTARVRGASGVDYVIGASGPETIHVVAGNSTLVQVQASPNGGWEAQHAFTGTGSYQTVTLVFGTAGNQTSSQLSIREAETVLDGTPFQVDVVEVSGFGIGTDPWQPTGLQTPGVLGPVPVFQASDTEASEGSWSLFMTADPGNGGYQRFTNIEPGVTYTASVDVGHASAASTWAFEARDVQGNLIGSDSATIATNAWTTLTMTFTVPDFLPGPRGELDLKVVNADAVQRSVYVDNLIYFQGNQPTTIGQILTDIYDDATTDHTGRVVWEIGATATPYLTLDFDAANDSNGNPWADPDIEIRLPMRYSYSQVMADFARLYGYEYRIVPDDPEAGTWLWQVYNPGGLGVDLSTDPGVALLTGVSDTRRGVQLRLPSSTDVMVEGQERATSRARDAGLITALGRIEGAVLNRDAVDVADAAVQLMGVTEEGQRVYQYTVRNPDVVPLVHYQIGDLIVLDDPPVAMGEVLRVMNVTLTLTAEYQEFTVQLNSQLTGGQAAVSEAVSRLMPVDPVHRPMGSFAYAPEFLQETSTSTPPAFAGGGAGTPTLVVAASDATDFSKSKADYICTGTDDEQTIQNAADIMPNGGRIVLSEGTFFFTDTDVVFLTNIHLLGMGHSTIIEVSGTGSAITLFDSTVENIYFREPVV